MVEKRPREPEPDGPSKRPKQGFSVGPSNLPDGTYKRKVQRIKRGLIEKAKIKKDYAKVKKREAQEALAATVPVWQQIASDEADGATVPASLELHPDRAAMLSGTHVDEPPKGARNTQVLNDESTHRRRRDRTNPYAKQLGKAEKIKAEDERRRQERAAEEVERQRKREQRESWRRQMHKARQPGRDGKRKLGRESKVLYEKVKSMVEAQKG